MDTGMNPPGSDGPMIAGYQNAPMQSTQTQVSGQIPVLSRAEILGMLQTLEQMRNAGVPPTDRRYVNLVKLLKAQNLSALQRKPTAPTETPSGKPNGVPQPPPSLSLPPLTDDGMDVIKPQAALGPFTAAQLTQLKTQILAYRYLSRNLPMPPALLAMIKNMQAKKPAYPQPTAYPPPAATPARPAPATAAPQPTPSQPATLDPRFLYSERERRIACRIQARISELSQLLPTLEGEAKTKALIELKQLRLVNIQKKVRREVADEMKKIYAMELAAERQGIKRARLELRPSQRFDRQLQLDTEQRRKQRHREFLNAVQNHARDFKEFHAQNLQRIKKLNRAVMQHHANVEKREAARRERAEKERLRALKMNNEDEYIRLLEQTKNERLKLLLRQTDEYLEKLGTMVQLERIRTEEEERREKAEEEGKEGEEGKVEAKDKVEDAKKPGLGRMKEKYYRLAHTVIEEIKTQPSMLVGGQLKEYQMQGLQWLVSLYNNNLNGILADEMGLGKTIQTIALICHLMERKKNNGPYLIVVPLSTMANWVMEFEKWAPAVKVVAYRGPPRQRRAIYEQKIAPNRFNVLLTTYEFIIKDKSALGKIKWNYIIIDEGHRMKNHHSKLATVFGCNYYSRHRLLLSGTPLQNSLTELWSLLNFLLPTIFNSAENFEQWFNAPFAAAGEKMEMNEEETLLIIHRLHQVLRPFLLRRLKSEVEAQLPEKIEKVIKCELSAWQSRLYKAMHERGALVVDPNAAGRGGFGLRGLMNTLMQLRKICNHPYLFESEGYRLDENLVRVSGKFAVLDRILPKLRAAGHRVLMFCQMTQLMNIMEDYFVMRGFKYLRLDGSTKADDRGELLERYNAPDSPYFIFILSTRAGGLGLNLQAADTVILFDSDWNPQVDLQAQDRAHRIGQTQEVRVFRLITHNSIEEKILERATFKLDMDAKIIQAGKFNNQSSAEERRAILEELLAKDASMEEEETVVISQEEQDDIVNNVIARNPSELALYESMDRARRQKDLEEHLASGKTGPLPPRLITDEELPDWLRNPDPGREEGERPTRRRTRSEVVYDDGLSESQWLQMVEDGEPIQPRRKRKAAEEAMRRGQKQQAAAREDALSNAYHRRYLEVWEAVKKQTAPDERLLIGPFMKLPSRRDYPDYFQIIKTPMSMEKIKAKIEKRQYASPEDFARDFNLIFSNAMEYNRQDSQIYQDAQALQAALQQELKSLPEKLEADKKAIEEEAAAAAAAAAEEAAAPASEEHEVELQAASDSESVQSAHSARAASRAGDSDDEAPLPEEPDEEQPRPKKKIRVILKTPQVPAASPTPPPASPTPTPTPPRRRGRPPKKKQIVIEEHEAGLDS